MYKAVERENNLAVKSYSKLRFQAVKRVLKVRLTVVILLRLRGTISGVDKVVANRPISSKNDH
jgi:hypothetical protein